MTVVTYFYDGEQTLKVNGEIVECQTPASIARLMRMAYDAGVKGEGIICDNQFREPTC